MTDIFSTFLTLIHPRCYEEIDVYHQLKAIAVICRWSSKFCDRLQGQSTPDCDDHIASGNIYADMLYMCILYVFLSYMFFLFINCKLRFIIALSISIILFEADQRYVCRYIYWGCQYMIFITVCIYTIDFLFIITFCSYLFLIFDNKSHHN